MKNHRSFNMWLICKLLPLFTFKGTKNREDAKKLLESIKEESEVPYGLLDNCKTRTSDMTVHGIPVFVIGDEYDDQLMFLHGGAFVFQLDRSHVDFCDRFAIHHKVKIIIPIYPLLPRHSFDEVFETLLKVYRGMPAGSPIMGDSAGAALAAGLSLQVAPRQLILFSPWSDLSLGRVKTDGDKMFSKEALEVYASAWAGGNDLKDPRISPLYGDLSVLPETVLYSGTSEMLYDDAKAFHEKLQASGVKSTFVEGRNMPHDFVLFPTPERDTVIREIQLKKGEAEQKQARMPLVNGKETPGADDSAAEPLG